VLGPYGSDSARAAAKSGAVVWNHGAAADDVQRLAGVVSVPSPASRYLVALARAVLDLYGSASFAVVAAPGRFARFAREGLEAVGIELVPREQASAILLCGPLEWEIEWFRRLDRASVVGGISPGLPAFAELLDPEGLLAPVQWHRGLGGPEGLEDYVAAQAYAAALIAERCLELDPADPLGAALSLRTSTFFGAFELGEDGLQAGHRLAVVRWNSGRQELFLAEAA
jgi:hypothetical protein